MKNILRVSLLSAVCVSAITASANAAGFYIQEQSVRGLGSAFSGSSSNLDDPSTVFFNPAGMTKLQGTQVEAGVSVLVPSAKVRNNGSTTAALVGLPTGGSSGNPYQPTPVPNGFVTYQINDNLWAGLSVTAPFGLSSEYDKGWFGRFDSTKTELTIFDIQPTLAYKVNDMLSVGAGINIEHSSADLRNSVVLGAATEGNSKLTGDDIGYGYSAGLQVKPTDATTIGLNYKSSVHHNLDGRILVTNAGTGATVVNSGGSAKLVTPDHVELGISQKLSDRWTVQGQTAFYQWSKFDNISAYLDSGALASKVEQDYKNTWAFALGAEYVASDTWKLRGGVQFDQTPTTDQYRTSRTPDGDRTWLSLGATYSMNQNLDLDLAATYIDIADGSINVNRGGTGRTIAKTDGQVGILALGLKYKF